MGLKYVMVQGGYRITGRLKSDQNGIEIDIFGSFVQLYDKLKSDQNGIEMFLVLMFFCLCFWLKSDQNGIEILFSA